jgi:hypothetical protein
MKSTVKADSTQDDDDLEYRYSSHLSIKPLTRDLIRQIRAVADVPGFDITDDAIELDYQGRDSGRKVVRVLSKVARLVGNAAGEVQCQISGDVSNLSFEFYRIRDGRLYRQQGEIVRSQETHVSDG